MPYAAGDDVAIEFLQVGRGEAKGLQWENGPFLLVYPRFFLCKMEVFLRKMEISYIESGDFPIEMLVYRMGF